MREQGKIRLRLMNLEDLASVMTIEKQSFPTAWPLEAFQTEIQWSDYSLALVLEKPEGDICGYAILHQVFNEVHICNIAVHPDRRGFGHGDKLLRGMLHLGSHRGGDYFTLEVRASNVVAQRLYLKYGFKVVAIRKGYYTDLNEDALVMVLEGTPDVSVADIELKDL